MFAVKLIISHCRAILAHCYNSGDRKTILAHCFSSSDRERIWLTDSGLMDVDILHIYLSKYLTVITGKYYARVALTLDKGCVQQVS